MILDALPELAADAAAALSSLLDRARKKLLEQVSGADDLDREQHALHAFAWFATYAEVFASLSRYATRLAETSRLGELELLLLQAAFGEYLHQVLGGIPMNQSEFARVEELGLEEEEIAEFRRRTAMLRRYGNTPNVRHHITRCMIEAGSVATYGDCGLDSTLDQMRGELRRFADRKIVPFAHAWHRANDYLPLELIAELAGLGIFALTLPPEFGGLGLGKITTCVVSEELSRGWVAVGSIGTRAEIASELILQGGTNDQKKKWLPKIASGEVLTTAVFTEPDTGSDLARLKTRAQREGDCYRITGSKTWITHPVRADLMTLLARTNPAEPGHKGLSMFLAEKPRGTNEDPFPVRGISGSEIEVLGYRGMKEYEMSFDGFAIPAENLLGGSEGEGFRQLMQTFESARIQTAARAIGVAQNALELAMSYALARRQFDKPIIEFPRISDKLAIIAVETFAARQLAYHAARKKDENLRCDAEAGMAKLLAARIAWAAADGALQIHGGNGFALEFPISRVLCDARVFSIFEGSAEIQAQVIARRLLEGVN